MGLLDILKAQEMDKAEAVRAELMGYTPDYSRGLSAIMGKSEIAANGHGSDAGKLPNHPTFSNEAFMSTEGMEGGTWGVQNGKDTYTPSLDQVLGRNPELSTKGLAQYMKRVEPNVQLQSPIPVDPAYFHKVTK